MVRHPTLSSLWSCKCACVCACVSVCVCMSVCICLRLCVCMPVSLCSVVAVSALVPSVAQGQRLFGDGFALWFTQERYYNGGDTHGFLNKFVGKQHSCSRPSLTLHAIGRSPSLQGLALFSTHSGTRSPTGCTVTSPLVQTHNVRCCFHFA